MVSFYSRRALSPFTGTVQVIDTPQARALSLDGVHWEITYRVRDRVRQAAAPAAGEPRYQMARAASVAGGRVLRHALHPFLDADAVGRAVDALVEEIAAARLPFAATDRWEYWLLDAAERQPLALLSSCISEDEMRDYPVRPLWLAMPAAQLPIDDDAGEDAGGYVAPVNYRLQRRVEQRAGRQPAAEWFRREPGDAAGFPPCLLREDWPDAGDARLCASYIRRLAPRLLMLQALPRAERARLERLARERALEVDRYCGLYPEIVDDKAINALRVEARLRRAAAS